MSKNKAFAEYGKHAFAATPTTSSLSSSFLPQTETGVPRPPPPVPRPSSSVMLVSPSNELLLLHRVRTSSAFASAHVFPGGTISDFHEAVPAVDAPDRHTDSPAYRMAAIRETFEESGILLAKKGEGLLLLSEEERERGRKATHSDSIRFEEWLAGVGGVPDVDGLIPFTRWITPPTAPKRFTAQMYLYLLPLDTPQEAYPAAHDGGIEHTEALWDTLSAWLAKARNGDIIVYEPQIYLLALLGEFFKGGDPGEERAALMEFIERVPTGSPHSTASIPWRDKVICSTALMTCGDGRLCLGLDEAGPELAGGRRGGDWDRVVVVKPGASGPRHAEVMWRKDVLAEVVEMPKL